jgi:hypothetical protein
VPLRTAKPRPNRAASTQQEHEVNTEHERNSQDDEPTVLAEPAWIALVFVVLGAGIGWLVKLLANWLVTLPWSPLEGPAKLLTSIPEPWFTIVVVVAGAVLGLLVAFGHLHESLSVSVSGSRVVLTIRDEPREYTHDAIGLVFRDGKHLRPERPAPRRRLHRTRLPLGGGGSAQGRVPALGPGDPGPARGGERPVEGSCTGTEQDGHRPGRPGAARGAGEARRRRARREQTAVLADDPAIRDRASTGHRERYSGTQGFDIVAGCPVRSGQSE